MAFLERLPGESFSKKNMAACLNFTKLHVNKAQDNVFFEQTRPKWRCLSIYMSSSHLDT